MQSLDNNQISLSLHHKLHDVDEPLLNETEDKNRYTFFPVKYDDMYRMYKKAVSAFWVPEEIDLSRDRFEDLTENERHFVKHVLAFFAASDGIVCENLAVRFSNDVVPSEAKAFYSFQIAMETIHSETYSQLIDTYIKDEAEKTRLFNAINTIPCVQKKADWALRWISHPDASFATRLVAFACVEGIFFSSSFAAIFWLKERNLMPGLCMSNELISRDEGLHCDFAVLLYRYIKNRLSPEQIYAIFREAVDIETDFIVNSIPCRLLGMNSNLMTQYIQFVADRLLSQLGYERLWNVSNPFDFMDRIGISNKTNFFEHRVSDYAKANVGVVSAQDAHTFSTEDDF
jgi:ribonucleotide reductase beta subunit family protein with ferritin-like domain